MTKKTKVHFQKLEDFSVYGPGWPREVKEYKQHPTNACNQSCWWNNPDGPQLTLYPGEVTCNSCWTTPEFQAAVRKIMENFNKLVDLVPDHYLDIIAV